MPLLGQIFTLEHSNVEGNLLFVMIYVAIFLLEIRIGGVNHEKLHWIATNFVETNYMIQLEIFYCKAPSGPVKRELQVIIEQVRISYVLMGLS